MYFDEQCYQAGLQAFEMYQAQRFSYGGYSGAYYGQSYLTQGQPAGSGTTVFFSPAFEDVKETINTIAHETTHVISGYDGYAADPYSYENLGQSVGDRCMSNTSW